MQKTVILLGMTALTSVCFGQEAKKQEPHVYVAFTEEDAQHSGQ